MLKIVVRLGKALSAPRDLSRAVGLTGHPTVLIQAGKCTASHSNPGCAAQLGWSCQQHQLAFSHITACLDKDLMAIWGAPGLLWRWVLRHLELGRSLH